MEKYVERYKILEMVVCPHCKNEIYCGPSRRILKCEDHPEIKLESSTEVAGKFVCSECNKEK